MDVGGVGVMHRLEERLGEMGWEGGGVDVGKYFMRRGAFRVWSEYSISVPVCFVSVPGCCRLGGVHCVGFLEVLSCEFGVEVSYFRVCNDGGGDGAVGHWVGETESRGVLWWRLGDCLGFSCYVEGRLIGPAVVKEAAFLSVDAAWCGRGRCLG